MPCNHATWPLLHHENPSTWAGVEPSTLGAGGQRQINHTTHPALFQYSNVQVAVAAITEWSWSRTCARKERDLKLNQTKRSGRVIKARWRTRSRCVMRSSLRSVKTHRIKGLMHVKSVVAESFHVIVECKWGACAGDVVIGPRFRITMFFPNILMLLQSETLMKIQINL
ncbi:hypothetical protein TNCV_4767441 [Trichonephila clavipes]|nr:hypothetical protein TNCV_4767441 [Trichonephila clavipes]